MSGVKRSPWSILPSQVAVVLAAWAYVVSLHWQNDGFWYQGDSSRHAANGLFWWDFLSSLPTNPLNFAVSYYARYPVINPTGWPPFFYLLEGLAYKVFGVSPFVAKALVLFFMLAATFYVLAWLRRWVGEAAGCAAALLPLQPAIVTWSHAVMLNVPAMALGVAALYHWRRWLDDPRSRHCEAAGAFAVAAVLTYVQMAVLVVVMAGWMLVEGKIHLLRRWRLWVVAAVAAVPLAAWALVAIKGAPGYREIAGSLGDYPVWKLASWTFYAERLPEMVSPIVLVAAGLGALLAAWTPVRRPEVRGAITWVLVGYASFSLNSLKEPRYALLLLPPVIFLAAVGIITLAELLLASRRRLAVAVASGALLALVGVQARAASAVSVPTVSGIREIVRYVAAVSPGERVFYEGAYYNGVFSFYTRASDSGFRRGVVVGHKLLYATMIEPRFGLVELASSPDDVIRLLQTKCGCRVLVVERQVEHAWQGIAAARALREAVARPEHFRLLRSFKVTSPELRDIDVYEQLGTIAVPPSVELPFPVLGNGVTFDAQPIARP